MKLKKPEITFASLLAASVVALGVNSAVMANASEGPDTFTNVAEDSGPAAEAPIKLAKASDDNTTASTAAVQTAAHTACEEQLVAALVEQYRMAMLHADENKLKELSDKGMSFGHSNGVVQTADEFIGSLVSKAEVFNTLTLTDRNVVVKGNVAYERHTFNADLMLNGKPLTVKLGSLQVWHKTDRWRLFARQAFAM